MIILYTLIAMKINKQLKTFPQGFDPGESRLGGSISNWFTPPLRGSRSRCGISLLKRAECMRLLNSFVLAF